MKRKSPSKANRKRITRTRKSGRQRSAIWPANVLRCIYYCFLVGLFVFTMGVTGYVIFFRTVSAAELPSVPSGRMSAVPEASDNGTVLKPKVAIIIDDLGYHYQLGRDLLALELELSFSFLPHAPYTRSLAREAYQQGRTILLHLPLEPRDRQQDPGPGALYTAGSKADYRRQLEANLLAVPHATGINNHMGSLFTENHRAMGQLLQLVKEQELYFIDSYTSPSSVGLLMAKTHQVATARRQLFLDNLQQPEHICAQLASLVRLAGVHGWAIGIGHPYPETYEALSSCGAGTLLSVDLVGVDKLVE